MIRLKIRMHLHALLKLGVFNLGDRGGAEVHICAQLLVPSLSSLGSGSCSIENSISWPFIHFLNEETNNVKEVMTFVHTSFALCRLHVFVDSNVYNEACTEERCFIFKAT